MSPVSGAVAVASVLLYAGAVAKIARPGGTARALRALGPKVGEGLVRVGAVAEAAVAVSAVALPGPVPAALLSASYAIFAVFVGAALRRGTPVSTCGCFGEVDSPPTLVHAVLNATFAAAAAFGAATEGPRSIIASFTALPWSGVPFALLVAVGAYLSYVAMVDLPRVARSATTAFGSRGGEIGHPVKAR